MPNKLLFGGWAVVPEAKTAAYTIKPRDCGKLFTNRGATGNVTFTLPKIDTVSPMKGFNVEFFTVAAFAISIVSDPADKLVVDSDLAADSINLASLAGQHARVICDGTGWLVVSDPSAATAATAVRAVTIAT